VKLVMPENVSVERKKVIGAYGAEIVYSDPMEGSDGAIRLCRKILADDPERYFQAGPVQQPGEPARPLRGHGPRDLGADRRAGSRTSSPRSARAARSWDGRYLKERSRAIQVIAAEPEDAFHGLEGLKHMASSIVPGIYHENELDQKLGIGTDDAYNMVYRLGREEGLIVGQSCGAALRRRAAGRPDAHAGNDRRHLPRLRRSYLSTNLWLGWQKLP
jgi:cysteine synthase B